MASFQEKTTADNKSVGFDYQYYYFLFLLLKLKDGEEIGIEVKDDVHLDLKDGSQVLIQLKHSIQTRNDKRIVNLTELDGDLWKTLYNWIHIINDKFEGRNVNNKQLQFMEKTKFILVSNKSSNKTNKFLGNVQSFKNNKINLATFKEYLEDLYIQTTDKTIKGYIELLKKQNNNWLSLFLQKLEFELDEDDLISKIKRQIREKLVKENRIDYVFESLDSNIRTQNYISIKKREKVIITFEEFRKKAEVYFEKARDSKLPIRKRISDFSGDPYSQVFIKQLLEIEVLDEDDIEELLKLTGYKLQAFNNLELWEQEGEITSIQRQNFEQNCIRYWKNLFDRAHVKIRKKWKSDKTSIDELTLIEYAQECYFNVLEKTLDFEDNRLDIEISNGQFYLLSDVPVIGWKLDWEDIYK
ncbi:hypothetical protein [Bacillus sp. AFS029533]|uniref:hypothetical protein n=1 Tax=Bacillus sp. AFS029533 TaxID=2033494 RepID=UPI000BFD7E1D|nr:hypothetical protein [Bacillus sp. AFS029533]PGZ92219.1 hypothetical protein COE53_12710 [Bacillus sp. AFS029533]